MAGRRRWCRWAWPARSGRTRANSPTSSSPLGVTAALVALADAAHPPGLVRDGSRRMPRHLIVAAAAVKRATMNMVVHAYDLFFYLGSWSTVSYLWSDQRRYVLAALAGLLAAALVAPARLPPRRDAGGAALVGHGARPLAARGLVRGREQGRTAPHAVLLLEPVRVVVLRILGRDAGGPLARGADGGRPARRWRRPPSRSRRAAIRRQSRRTSC